MFSFIYKQRLSLSGFLCCLLLSVQAYSQHSISVDAGKILNDVSSRPIGINVNYLMDGSYLNAAQSTTEALKSMGVKFLRYPGGEKSDNYLWSVSPWTSSQPKVARTGAYEWPSGDLRFTEADYTTLQSHVLDFDEFMGMSKSIGGEPIIVVTYDAMYKPAAIAGAKVPTKEELLKHAEEWVRYANITKKYGIKYWMIGNESYHECGYNGCATATQYRDDVIAFSKRMKAVDPSIKIIANGISDSWWATILPAAAPHIDLLGLSNYPVWKYTGGYEFYRNNTPGFMGPVNTAINAVQKYAPASDRSRIKIITSEFNSNDWSKTWPDNNDLGHALVSFEIMGEHLKNPQVLSANFWNTRWIENATSANNLYDALDKDGNMNANGKTLSIWGNYLLKKMIQTTSTRAIRNFATLDAGTQKLNIFLINKESSTQSVQLSLLNYLQAYTGKRWEFTGTGPGDTAPKLNYKNTFTGNGSPLSFSLPPASITILELTGATAEICDGKDNDADGVIDEGCPPCTASGNISREIWTNISGGLVSDIPLNSTPASTGQLSIFEVPSNIGTNYGQRIRGYICPPQTGNYTFWIAGDDNCELWLSTDDTPTKKVRIAHVSGSSGWTYPREWSKYTSQKSTAISLVAGKKYYIEALHKENGGGDNLAVGWQLPNGTAERPIPGNRLSPFTGFNMAPVVALTAPLKNASFTAPTSIHLTATGSDSDGSISKVEFYHGTTKLGEDLTNPYEFTWNNVAAGSYQLMAKAIDNQNAVTTSAVVTITLTTSQTCVASGTILREVWYNVSGNAVNLIPVNTTPHSSSQLTVFEAPTNFNSSYGQRLRGYICPPQTGNYTFWIASDDNSELWLSTDADPVRKVKIASVNYYTGVRQWDKYPSQKSVAINLHAGKRYYIEALHKEGLYSDNLAVGWQLPNGTYERPISGNRLSPFAPSTVREDFELAAAETKNIPSLQVSPNPFRSGKLLVQAKGLESAEEVKMDIYNSVGILVTRFEQVTGEQGSFQKELQVGKTLLPGIYTLLLHTHKTVITHKLVVTSQ